MGFVYHGSKESGLKRLEPRKSTHGNYVYATTDKALAIHFSGRSGDDMVYELDHFTNKDGPWELVELVPGAFERMYDNSSSIYVLSDETFKDIKSGFCEVVSESKVEIVDEIVIDNVYDAIFDLEKEGKLIIYRYPDKPECMKQDGSSILDKIRMYHRLGMKLSKNTFDRLVYLHPELLEQINSLIVELGFKYNYKTDDLVYLFAERVNRQIKNPDNEQYIESSYVSICNTYPELVDLINPFYEKYRCVLMAQIDLFRK